MSTSRQGNKRTRQRNAPVQQPEVIPEEIVSSEDELSPLDDYPFIEFRDKVQKDRFVYLLSKSMSATRCVDREILRTLKIDDIMFGMFNEIGLQGLFTLHELSYPALTLEFLSSYTYFPSDHLIRFRLLNVERSLTFGRISEILELDKHTEGDLYGAGGLSAVRYFPLFTGYMDADVSAMALLDVQHVCLRMFLRYLSYLLFGRTDKSKTSSIEVLILASYLNPFREETFQFSPPALVCSAFDRAIGRYGNLDCGALVTKIARAVCDFEGDDPYEPMADYEPLVDDDHLRYDISYLDIKNGTDHYWRVRGESYMLLPCARLPSC
ncbi:uncharacterized protein LOC141641252 [Silene latifolia]|uniref:uncharacterized protein LOC141641252 n=1 Tax=Silene latifolia TaxID=37657 RepID=UPI003D76AA29